MHINHTIIDGLFELNMPVFVDNRGTFVKPYSKEIFESNNLDWRFEEAFYSVSKKNVLRGFHIQLPPRDSKKLVWVSDGAILDVTLDLRRQSSTYGQLYSTVISSEKCNSVYIPAGIAHAFYVLGESATVVYQVGACFSSAADSGIKWDSAGFQWPCSDPIVSIRDQVLPEFAKYVSPF